MIQEWRPRAELSHPAAAAPRSARRPNIGRASARSLLFRSLAAAASFFTVFVTARGFGAEGRGVYALASVSLSIMLSLLGGASTVLAAELAHRRATMSRLYAAGIVVAVVGGLTVCGVVYAARIFLLDWHAEHVFEYAAVALPAALLTQYAIQLLMTHGDVGRMHWFHLSQVMLPLVPLT